MILRPYQREAIDAVHAHLNRRDDNPCVVIPTGGGKTPVMATLCADVAKRWGGRVLVLAHVKELLEQTAGTLRRMAPDLGVGVYSAGLGRRDTRQSVIVAGIQSVYKRAAELDRFDLVLVDESHLIPPDGEGMYQQFLAEAKVVNPNLRLVGLTATPYRTSTGMICQPDHLLNHICYEANVRELIRDGYLCPLKTKAGVAKADTSELHTRLGEFIAEEVEELMDQTALVDAAVKEIIQHTKDRKAVLIFTSGVKHGEHVCEALSAAGLSPGFITGTTPDRERDETIRAFREGGLKFLVNVNVLTTGFDAPNVDAIVLLRPTMSPGLYYQMCLDLETEVLTPRGWSRHDEVQTGDMVGAFDLETGNITFCQAQGKVHRSLAPGESMYGVVAPHLDIRVTDRHDMVYRGRSRSCLNWKKREAGDLARYKDSFYVPVSGYGDGPGVPLTDDELRFLGWFFTDGHRNPSNNTIIITQSAASQHVPAIEAMLRGCGLGYRVYRCARTGEQSGYPDGLQFVIPYGQPRGMNRHLRGWKHMSGYFGRPLLESLAPISRRQLRVMLDAMNLGDGRKHTTSKWHQRTIDLCIGEHKFLADQLQALCILRGFRCNIAVQQQKTSWHRYNPKPQYILHVREQQAAIIGGANSRGNALIPRRSRFGPVPFNKDEHVWCMTTEYGTLVTRRRGKVCIVGNCGRGFRISPGKTDCLVLDFGNNVLRHGPIDALRIEARGQGDGEAPAKECPQCQAIVHAAFSLCPDCGFEFPPRKRATHGITASGAAILSGEVETEDCDVSEISYTVHKKKDAPIGHPQTMRVRYVIGWQRDISEWICFEHPTNSYARRKAEEWWAARSSEPCPTDSLYAVQLAERGAVTPARKVTIRTVSGERYPTIIGHVLDEIRPDCGGICDQDESSLPAALPFSDDEIPF